MTGVLVEGSDPVPTDLLDSLVEAGPDALLVISATGEIILANAAAEQMFGCARSELLGRPYSTLMPEGFVSRLSETESELSRNPGVRQAGADLDLFARRSDGTEFPVEVNYCEVDTSAGPAIAASVRDVSARRHTDTELRDALSLLAATLESTADGILVVSADGQIAGSNERFAELWRIPDELLESHDDARVMGFVLDQLVDAEAFVAKVHELYDDPEAESNDVLEFRDGRIFERYSRPQRVGDEIVGRVWSLRDVTARQLAQEQAREARAELSSADARFRALVESSDDAILSTTPDGAITSWNAAANRLFGYTRDEIIGQPLTLLIPGDASVPSGEERSAPSGGTASRGTEADCVRKDGTVVPVSLTVSPIYDDEQLIGISAIMRDITDARERRRELLDARAAAVEASQAKSDFLATMSHEIRTPMNGVIGLTGLLLGTELDEVQRRYAAGVRGAGEALLAIVDDILDFSKLEAGKVALEEAEFSPRELVEEIGVLLAESAGSGGLEFIVDCDAAVPASVVGDPGRLRQTLINLTGNAIKFTPAGEVALSVRAEPAGRDHVMLRFEVRDTGIGIDAPTLARLFEPFSQADASTTRRFGGTGLGLAISRRLVVAMGGELAVHSERGKGSVFGFSVLLPVAADTAPPDRRVRALSGRRALVVDDNRTNRLILVGLLREWGIDSDDVADAATALTAMKEAAADGTPYDFALLDLMMPDTDGLQLASMISAEPGLSSTRSVILTSGVALDTSLALEAGVQEWVSKPVRPGDLRDAMVRLSGGDATSVAVVGATAPDSAGAGTAMRRVLVAEDNPVNQMVAIGVLEGLGYSVEVASTGRQALGALESGVFDAVLMDCHMPDVDGFEATRELRQREGDGRRTPVIAMTAGVLDEDRDRCLAAGMDDFVAKPIDIEHLRRTLSRWVRRGLVTSSRLDALRAIGPADGWGLLPAVVQAFLDGAGQQLLDLRAAVEAGAGDAAREIAHSLRGAAASLGADTVMVACADIEERLQSGDGMPSPALVDRLARELEAVCDELAGVLSQRG